ncbi:Possible cobalt-zinc-cadmium resistance protein (Cation efflux system protein) [Oleispira antarctica RB-8]|uniref:Possible cobalt-zinc-cadmium resistance protein (Cation efflux system protein) n=1 Tax=Oleispira antarctica RB-8 TaxID=698738 RepID=R4YK58_OLEAN|nr:Possible cobalt-zinc-cadmium resistance protein (Cation efflux system protein) [Oleispira antarctica RB-8]
MNLLSRIIAPFFIMLALVTSSFVSSVFASDDHDHDEHEEEHADSTEISTYYIQVSGIKSEAAGSQNLAQIDTLFGVISPVQDQVFSLHATFPSMVEKVFVQVGDQVKKGQILARLSNIQTLQSYTLKSPSNGEVTSRSVNTGNRIDAEEMLQVSDLSKVWVNLSAFPENIERLKKGQRAKIYDLHDHENAIGEISYIAPQMSGGHIARARAIIDNQQGHWRPGMHIKADVEVSTRTIPIAVKVDALQTMEDQTVVFKRHGNKFETTPVEVGEKDGQWAEILSGLSAGDNYVSENSFLIKADILKSGASHDH